MKVILTGATGMVGGHLAEKLVEKLGRDSVFALVRRKGGSRDPSRQKRLDRLGIRQIPADLMSGFRLPADLPEIDVVFHLAANLRTNLSQDREDSPMRVNDTGTRRLIEELGDRLKGKLFVYSSSIAVVDPPGHREEPVDEDSACTPRTLYGRTKLRGEEIVRDLSRERGFRYAIFRLGTVYGTNCREGHIFNRFTQWVRQGALPGRILWPGRISLVHVDDVVDVLCKTVELPALQGDTFFIAHSEKVTVGEWAKIMSEALGLRRRFFRLPGWIAAPLRWTVFQFWFWRMMPECLTLAAWRLSLILSNGFFCDNSKLRRVYPKEYIDVREGVRRTYARMETDARGSAA